MTLSGRTQDRNNCARLAGPEGVGVRLESVVRILADLLPIPRQSARRRPPLPAQHRAFLRPFVWLHRVIGLRARSILALSRLGLNVALRRLRCVLAAVNSRCGPWPMRISKSLVTIAAPHATTINVMAELRSTHQPRAGGARLMRRSRWTNSVDRG